MKNRQTGRHTMTDTQAMAAIHAAIDGREWNADTMDSIADIVRATGRQVRDVDDDAVAS